MSEKYPVDGDTPTPLPVTILRGAEGQSSHTTKQPRRISVLLIEDDPDDSELIEILLGQVRGSPFQITSANDLEQGIARLRRGGIDVILLDLTLPGTHGLESLTKLGDVEHKVPVIVLTGIDDATLAIGAMQRGAQDYLTKGGLNSDSLVRALRYSIERKAAERRLLAQYAVTTILAECATLNEATPRILKAICESLGWDLGAIWEVDAVANVLFCVNVWHRPELAISDFENATRRIQFHSGVGLPGRVWQRAEPAWIPDVTRDDNFPRAEIADQSGLHGAFGFPVLFDRKVTGVLEFFSRQIQKPDRDLLSMLDTLGSQIGQFIGRRRANEAHQLAEAKYREIFENAIEGIFQTSPQGRFLTANPTMARILGYESPEQLMSEVHDIGQELHVDVQRREEIRRMLDELGFVQRLELQLYRRDGSKIWVSTNIRAVRDEAGRVIRYEGSAEDITERKRAEEVERELLANEEEFRIAREIQQKLFPTEAPSLAQFDIAGKSYPAVATSGDYYDYISLPDGSLEVVIGDVAGHGFGPALLMADIRAYLRALAPEHADFQELLNLLNRLLMEDVTEGRYVTLFVARLDPKTRSLTYASAGHPPAYVIDAEGSVRATLVSTSWPLGIEADSQFTVAPPLRLEAGELIVMMTDGICEAMGNNDMQFGTARVLKLIAEYRDRPASEIVEALYNAVREFCEPNPLLDDITLLVIKALPEERVKS